MRISSGIAVAIIGAVTVFGSPGMAQAPAAPAATAASQLQPGATIYDTTGAEVAKVESIAGPNVNVDTGTNKLVIPAASFGAGANGPVINATRAQLDAAATQAAASAKAALMAKLVPGAEVRGQAGENVIGSIKSISGDLVLVTTPNGDVNVPSASFLPGPSGVLLQMSADDFNKAVAAAKG